MKNSSENPPEQFVELKLISTHWTIISNPSQFITLYGAAVRAYLRALLPTFDDADEVEQEFLLQVVTKGFPIANSEQGLFRYYLIAVIRNAAYAYLRKQAKRPILTGDLSNLSTEPSANEEWQRSWRDCVLKSTWSALRDHQKRNKNNLFHSVLKASVEHPNEDSVALAARVSQATKQALSAESFRKQLSRARQHFAKLLIEEVASTIGNCTPEILADELRALDLMKYVKRFVPENGSS